MVPTPTSWTDLTGQRVGVWGLGTEGLANLARLRAVGAEPVIVDDHPDRARAASGDAAAVLAADSAGMAALRECAIVVKSPGVSRHRPEVTTLLAAGVRVVGGMSLWLADTDRQRVVCITGTKGKSTTTEVAAHLAKGLGVRAAAGGNLGAPPWAPDAPRDVDLWVVETSSYQAADLEVSPPVVAVTSLAPDHLPWHGDTATYYADKLSLCTRTGVRVAVAAANSAELVAHRHLLGPTVRWVDVDTYDPTWAVPLGLRGTHNVVNAAVARAVLEEVGLPGASDDAAVRQAAEGFGGLEGRLETVAVVDGVEFVDDTLSTNVLPTLAALDTFGGRRIALIAGGADRGLDHRPLGEAIAARTTPTLVATAHTTGPAIAAAVREAAAQRAESTTEVVECADLADAVRRAWRWARPDGVVLLSPAAASFDAFTDHRHRSRTFRDCIAGLR